MKTKIVYLVSECTSLDNNENTIPRKVFDSEEEANKYADELIAEVIHTPAFDENQWDIIEFEFFNLTEDNPDYINEAYYRYPNETEEWYKRQAEIDKLEHNTYLEILIKKFPEYDKEQLTQMLSQQMNYLEHFDIETEIKVDKIEYVYEE